MDDGSSADLITRELTAIIMLGYDFILSIRINSNAV